jgi:hypothetical protein
MEDGVKDGMKVCVLVMLWVGLASGAAPEVTIRLSSQRGSGISRVINATGNPVITTQKAIVD